MSVPTKGILVEKKKISLGDLLFFKFMDVAAIVIYPFMRAYDAIQRHKKVPAE